jgi:para-aminobenzoate synthetase/4-amino-4-deoxychorismate lyase
MTTLPTPDPAHGLFETLLVLDGEPVALDAHLDRLAASLDTLFGVELPAGLAEEAAEHARGLRLGRMRIAVRRSGHGAELATQEVDPADFFPDRGRGAELRSLAWPGGLGPHKWADRRLLGEGPEEAVSLLFDGDEALEAGRGNVFAVFAGVLKTPVADGRILPGTTRAATIAIARAEGIEVRQERLGRDELFAADEVFLTGSVRGVEPARSLDGVPLPGDDRVGRRIGEALLLKWRTGRLAAAGS